MSEWASEYTIIHNKHLMFIQSSGQVTEDIKSNYKKEQEQVHILYIGQC